MGIDRKVVHVIDEDPAARRATADLLADRDYDIVGWEASAFLTSISTATPGCVIIDPCYPGMDSLAIHATISDPAHAMPSIVVTNCRDVERAICLVRHGAVDFLAKPVCVDRLEQALATGFGRLVRAQRRAATVRRVHAVLEILTPRERDVLNELARGLTNKEIARKLAISPRTVEIFRANIMTKLNAESLSQVLRIAFVAELCAMVNPALHVGETEHDLPRLR